MTTPTNDTSAGRRVVARYSDYAQAQRAVDYLSDEGFPVEHVSIVGEGLRFVEQVTGRKNLGRAALQGAISGAFVGAVIGFLFGLFSLFDPLASALVLALYGLVFGAIAGAIIGAISHALSGGQRDFSSVGDVRASSYEVQVALAHAERAEQMLERMPTARPTT